VTQLVPNRFLFDFEIPLSYRSKAPRLDGGLSGWTDAERLPNLEELDGRKSFADVWACWNDAGLFFACEVQNKQTPLQCDPKSFWTGDNLRICTDMRDARTNRRATRYCQQFYFLPAGGGKKGDMPVAGVNPIKRARENAAHPGGVLEVASKISRTGYTMEVHLPASCLSGFDPAEHPRIGLYYLLEDADHGQQYLTVGDELSWYIDPSTWATAVLEHSAPRSGTSQALARPPT
jgi:hypothetical protein